MEIENLETIEEIYKGVGIILEITQKWEKEFRNLATKFSINQSDDIRSLNNINRALKRENVINEKEFDCFRTVIIKRNFLIHRFFVSENNIKEFNEIINQTYCIVNQARDLVLSKLRD